MYTIVPIAILRHRERLRGVQDLHLFGNVGLQGHDTLEIDRVTQEHFVPCGRQHGPSLVLLDHVRAGACLGKAKHPVRISGDARQDPWGALGDLASAHRPYIVLSQVFALVESTQKGRQLCEGHIGLLDD